MSWPVLPVAARVQRVGWPAVWLPLFVLWPLIIAAFALALTLCLFASAPRRAVLAALVASYDVLCALHGTTVELEEPAHGCWSIAVY